MTALLAGAVTGLAAAAAWMIPGSRVTPEERERKRRLNVHADGRVGSATVTDFHDACVCYKYTVGGLEYFATQDVTAFLKSMPEEAERLIERPASLRYLAHNPANSIVICENWTGLRFRRSTEQAPDLSK